MIAAIIPAAGRSRRMGRPKMALPWAGSTVIQTVVQALQQAGLSEILVVSGADHEQVEPLVADPVRVIYNENHAAGEMLGSVQAGLRAVSERAGAVLICLGDQPQIQVQTIRSVCEAFRDGGFPMIVPSYAMRRGHPWLVSRNYWREIQSLRPPATLRDFLNTHKDLIHYVPVETPSILADLDTPQDYLKTRP